MRHTVLKLKLLASKSLLVLCVLTPVLLFGAAGRYFMGGQVAAATASTVNFQARLMTNTGAIAADGDYNVEFKLYDTLSTGGTGQGVCTGNCKWVETRTSTNKVHVANGYLSVNLGSVTSFPTTINWDQDLWLTMNIGGTGTPTWDGEMSPRLKLTALPYAFRAGQLASLAGSHTGVLQFTTTLLQDSVITLPDPGASTATVCYQGSSSCGFATGTSGSYIQNGLSQQTANFNIIGNNTANPTAQIQGIASGTKPVLQLLGGSTPGVGEDILDIQDFNGANTFLKVDNAGLATLNKGLTAVGGTVNLNFNSNNDTNINTGTSTGNVAIGNGAAGTLSLQSASTIAINTTNFKVSTAGVVTLAGGQTPDITTTANGSGSANAITLTPGSSGGASSNGATVTISGGAATGTTSVTAGGVTLQGGNATGASGTRNGGGITLDAGTGATANGDINIGANIGNDTINIGGTGVSSPITSGTQTVNVGTNNTAGSTVNVVVGSGVGASGGTTTVRSKGNIFVTSGNSISMTSVNSSSANTGSITLQTGNAVTGTNLSAGGIIIDTGTHTGTGTGAITIGTTNATSVQIGNSASTTTVTGILQASGGAISLNDNSNFNTKINTGTSTGAISIGNSASGTLALQGGASTSLIVNNGAGNTTTLNFTAPSGANTITFPAASGTVQLAPTTGGYIQQVPTTTAINTIAPTAANVVALTIKGTTNVTSAHVLDIYNSAATPTLQGYFDANGSLNVSQLIQPTASNTIDLGTTSAAFRTGYFGSVASTGTNALNLDTGGIAAINIGVNGTSVNGINIGNATSNPNIAFNGSGTFGTSTGNVSLNGATQVAANKNFSLAAGTGTITQAFSAATAGNAQTLGFANANTGAGVAIQGINITPTNTSTATSGTNQLNLINFAAGGALGGTDNTTGINFASATGYSNFIKTPTFNLSSNGQITVGGGLSPDITTAVTGGVAAALTLQPGTATGTNNGATVTLQGGTAGGTGVKGLIQLNGATYFTTGSYSSGSTATITQSLIDSNSAILATATNPGLTFTVPSPTVTTASGHILYITNAGGTNAFILAGAGTSFSLNIGSTATLLWNGSAWTSAGVDASTLQNVYNNSTGSNTPEILLDSSPHKGLDIQDANTTIGANESLLSVRASATATSLGASLFVVNASGKVGINLGGNTNVTAPTINNDLSFGQIAGVATARTIGVDTQTGTNIGGNGLSLTAGTANGTGAGGQITLQGGGTGTGAGAVGGAVLIQGGTSSGASGASNGGAITLQGGTPGTGGVKGLIQLNGATYFTTGSYSSASSATITQSLVDSNSAILASATNPSLTFTVPSPTTSVSGRLLYVTNSGTNAFTLSFSTNTLTLNPGATATLIWNAAGSVWTGAGADSSSLQNGYNNSTGGTTPEILLDGASHFGLDIQDANTTLGSTVPLLAVRASATATTLGSALLTVENNAGKPLVGIGTALPSRPLDISVNTSTVNALPLLIEQSGTGDTGVEYKSASKNFFEGIDNTDGQFKISSALAANGTQTQGDTNIESTPPGDTNANGTQAYKVVASVTGTVSSMSVYLWDVGTSPNIQMGIYADSGAGTTPGTLLGTSSITGAVVGWNTLTVSGVSITSGSTYWLAFSENGFSHFARTVGGGVVAYDIGAGVGYPVPTTWSSSGANSTDKPSFYITVVSTSVTDDFNGTPLFRMSETGQVAFQNAANSTTAFQLQNVAGTTLLGLDTSNAALNLGVTGSTATASTVNVGTSTGATQAVNIGSSTANSAANGTTVLIQGGNTATAVQVQALAGGTINVGTANAANTIQIGTSGSTLTTGSTQVINIGNSAGAGTTNVTVGSTSSAGAGTTTVQAKGQVTITAGATSTWSTSAGDLTLQAGTTATTGGTISVVGGTATGANAGGTAKLQGGPAAATAGSNGGGVSILGAAGTSTGTGGAGGTLQLTAGNAGGSGNNAGGSIIIQTGAATGTGVQGTFQVQNAVGASLLTVDPSNTAASLNLISNGGAETGSPPTGFAAQGSGSSVATGTGTDAASGAQSAKVTFGTTTLAGTKISFATAPTASTTVNYIVSFSAKQVSGTAVAPGNTALQVVYSPDNGTTLTATCSNYSSSASLSTTAWTKVTCTFIPGSTTVTTALLIIRQADTPGVSRVIDIDNVSVVQQNSSGTTNVGDLKVGGAQSQGLTLFTLDTYAATPFSGSNTSLAGSMYFDTSQGKIQCYDGSNWGACGAAPNTIVTLTPEYAGAVLDSAGVSTNIGTMTSDFCANSAALTVGTLCSSGDARNFYKWTSPQGSLQSYSIFVTYKLPATFKSFVASSTSLTGLVDNTTNASVKYAIFKSTGSAVTSCSATATVVGAGTGSANTWTTGVAGTLSGSTDPSTCGFVAGNNIIFQITVQADNNASAYPENLNFQYSNQ